MRPAPGFAGVSPDGLAELIREVAAAHNELAQVSSTLVSELSELGLETQAARQIGRIATDLGVDLQMLRKRHGEAVALGQDGSWVAGYPDGLSKAFDTPKQARQRGRELARKLAEITDGGTEPIPKELLDKIRSHYRDPFFAKAFITQLGAERLTTLAARLHVNSRTDNSTAADVAPGISAQMASMLSQMLASASRPTQAGQLGEQFQQKLLGQLDTDLNRMGLSTLLSEGQYETDFLTGLVKGIYKYEQEHGLPPTTPAWGPLSDPMVGALQGLGNNPAAAQEFFYQHKERMQALLVDRKWELDQGNALGEALEAATTVFRDHQPEGADGVPSRGYQSAWVAAHTVHAFGKPPASDWSEFWGDPKEGRAGVPEGMRDSMGVILANYFPAIHNVSQSELKIGRPGVIETNRETDGDERWKDPIYTRLDGTQPWAMKVDGQTLMNVLSYTFKDTQAFHTVLQAQKTYAHALFADSCEEVGGKLDTWLDQQREQLKRDHPAWSVERIQRELAQLRENHLRELLSSGTGTKIDTRAKNVAKTLANVIDAAEYPEIEDAREAKSNMQTLRTWVTFAAFTGGSMAGGWTGFAANRAVATAWDSAVDYHPVEKALQDADEVKYQAKTALKTILAQEMLSHDLFGPPGQHPYTKDSGFPSPGSAGDFIEDGHIIRWDRMTTIQRRAYQAWLHTSNDEAVMWEPRLSAINNAIGDEYEEALNYYHKPAG